MPSNQTIRRPTEREPRAPAHARRRRNFGVRAFLLALVAAGAVGCHDNVLPSFSGPRLGPAPLAFELTPHQQQLLMRPASPEAIVGRPATRADLEEARSWFGPGELEAILAIVNRSARARGADTLPHCLPLCDPGASAVERGAR